MWEGRECQQGFYLIYYNSTSDRLILGTGSAVTYDLVLPYDHELKRIVYAKENTNSHDVTIDYAQMVFDKDTYYETLYSNSAFTGRTATIELGSEYEGLAGSRIRLTATITNTEQVAFYLLVKFLEVPT